MKKLLLLLCLAFNAPTIFAQQPLWTSQYANDTRAFNRDIAVDNNGNIYSCGYFYNDLRQPDDLPSQNLTSTGGSDIYISKHTPNGRLLWVKQLKGNGEDRAHSIALDGLGHIYISGAFQDTITTVGGDTAISEGMYDGVLIKADTNGTILWLESFGGKRNDEAHKVVLAQNGHLLIGGYYTDSIVLAADTLHSASSAPLLLRVDPSGSLVMSNTIHTNGTSYIYGLTEMSNGKVAATGSFELSITKPNSEQLNSLGEKDAYIAIFDGQEYESLRGIQSSGDNVGYALAANAEFLYATGSFSRKLVLEDSDDLSELKNGGERDGYILKLDTALNIVSGSSLGGRLTDQLYNMAATRNGLFIVGSMQAITDMGGDHLIFPVVSEGLEDAYVAKYNLDTELQWAQTYGSTGRDIASGIAVSEDQIIVSGLFINKLTNPYAVNPNNEQTIVRSDLTTGGSPFIAKLQDCTIPNELTYSDGVLTTTATADRYEWLTHGSPLKILETNTSGEYSPREDGYYAVRMTRDGCSSISEWLSLEKVNISETIKSTLTISPNPTTGLVTLRSKDNPILDFTLTDISGKKLLTGEQDITLDLSELPAGIYYIYVNTTLGSTTSKLIKH